jgi:hypothetical protein
MTFEEWCAIAISGRNPAAENDELRRQIANLEAELKAAWQIAAEAQHESDMEVVGTSQCLCLENLRQNPLVPCQAPGEK